MDNLLYFLNALNELLNISVGNRDGWRARVRSLHTYPSLAAAVTELENALKGSGHLPSPGSAVKGALDSFFFVQGVMISHLAMQIMKLMRSGYVLKNTVNLCLISILCSHCNVATMKPQ